MTSGLYGRIRSYLAGKCGGLGGGKKSEEKREMGIKGLLQFLKGAQRDVHLESFRGLTAAVDAYCWLHKGAYSCAKELVTKERKLEDLPFLRYCMKRVNLLRRYDITVIVVFDGARLPMKAHTEAERRKNRQSYLAKGKALLKEGKTSQAVDCFQRCIDVSPQMALAFIQLLRKEGIQTIVAPYEADAQLAYLVKEGLAQFVITEDSDLLAFGCPKVFFKMGDTGHGKLIELKDIGKGNKSLIGFTPESFRHVCILCGCDYLPSIPGVGPSTAAKLMRKLNKDPYRVIRSLKSTSGKVPENYEEEFRRADHTFLYQLVFDPQSQTQVRLTTPPSDIDVTEIEEYTGLTSSPSKQVGLARGNINPLTLEKMDTYSPAKQQEQQGSSSSVKSSMKRSQTWSGSVMSKSGGLPRQSTLPISEKAKNQFKKSLLSSSEEEGKSEAELTDIYSSKESSSSSYLTPNSTKSGSGRKSVFRNIFSKERDTTVVLSKYFGPSNKTTLTKLTSSLEVLDKLKDNTCTQIQSSSVDSGIGHEEDEYFLMNAKEEMEGEEIEEDLEEEEEEEEEIEEEENLGEDSEEEEKTKEEEIEKKGEEKRGGVGDWREEKEKKKWNEKEERGQENNKDENSDDEEGEQKEMEIGKEEVNNRELKKDSKQKTEKKEESNEMELSEGHSNSIISNIKRHISAGDKFKTISLKRKLLNKEDHFNNKRHKVDDDEIKEENDCIILSSSSTPPLVPKIVSKLIPSSCRRIGLTKNTKRSSFTAPRPAGSGTLHSYFSYTPKERLKTE